MKNKAFFIQRLAAFAIDMSLILFISSLLSSPFIDSKSVKKLDDSSLEIANKYTSGEIDIKTYLSENSVVSYELAKCTGLTMIMVVFFSILYFVVYQFYNKGQTLGKKILRIKVKSMDGELTINSLIFRSLIINLILFRMLCLCFIVFANSRVYFYGTMFFELVSYTLLIGCGLMAMFSKDGRGLHDIIAHTKVVSTSVAVKERELCES